MNEILPNVIETDIKLCIMNQINYFQLLEQQNNVERTHPQTSIQPQTISSLK